MLATYWHVGLRDWKIFDDVSFDGASKCNNNMKAKMIGNKNGIKVGLKYW